MLIIYFSTFFFQRGQLFQVARVLADEPTPLYYINDLKGAPVKETFYKQQLRKVPKPSEGELFKVEKILKERRKKGKREFLVKFKFYPPKVRCNLCDLIFF